MKKAIAVFWLSLTHNWGLCKPFHRTTYLAQELQPWQGKCPVVDRILIYLYPKIEIEIKK